MFFCDTVTCVLVWFVLWMQLLHGVTVNDIQDLIKCTPTSHADYDLLQNTLSSAQDFIESFNGTSDKEKVCLSSVTVRISKGEAVAA